MVYSFYIYPKHPADTQRLFIYAQCKYQDKSDNRKQQNQTFHFSVGSQMLSNRDPWPVSQNSTKALEVTPAPPATIYNPLTPTVQPYNQNFVTHQKPCG